MFTSTVECRLYKLISDKVGLNNQKLDDWIKFLSTKNTIILYCTIIIIKTKKLLKQVKHEKLM
jgi:hypothetical protein